VERHIYKSSAINALYLTCNHAPPGRGHVELVGGGELHRAQQMLQARIEVAADGALVSPGVAPGGRHNYLELARQPTHELAGLSDGEDHAVCRQVETLDCADGAQTLVQVVDGAGRRSQYEAQSGVGCHDVLGRHVSVVDEADEVPHTPDI
jgi:hypothetical protein